MTDRHVISVIGIYVHYIHTQKEEKKLFPLKTKQIVWDDLFHSLIGIDAPIANYQKALSSKLCTMYKNLPRALMVQN